jgi:ABC-type branched-subunit amino acid transport system permease subunit
MDFASYLIEKMLVLVPVLYIIGMVIKNTPNVKDWLIPWIILILGVVAAVAIGLTTGMTVVDSIIQGVLVAGVTVFTNQLITQTKDKD